MTTEASKKTDKPLRQMPQPTKKDLHELQRFVFTVAQKYLRFRVPEAPHLWKHAQIRTVLDDQANIRVVEFRLGLLANRAPTPQPIKVYQPDRLIDVLRERYPWIRKLTGEPRMKTREEIQPFTVRMCPHHNLSFRRDKKHVEWLRAKDFGLPSA